MPQVQNIEGRDVAAFGEVLFEVQGLNDQIQKHSGKPAPPMEQLDNALLVRMAGNHMGRDPEITDLLRGSKTLQAKLVRLLGYLTEREGTVPLAGDVFNVHSYIMNLQKLDHFRANHASTVKSLFVGPVGTNDSIGKRAWSTISRRAPSWSEAPSKEISGYGILLDEGKNKPVYDRKDGAARDYLADAEVRSRIVQEAVQQGIFYTSMVAVGITRDFNNFLLLLKELRQTQRVVIVVDTNFRDFVMKECLEKENTGVSALQAFEAVLEHTDILFGGREDLGKFFPGLRNGNVDSEIRNFFGQVGQNRLLTMIKAGDRGVYWALEGQPVQHTRAMHVPPEKIVDDTGAGDAVDAALLVQLCLGEHTDTAMGRANAVASCVIQEHGAVLQAMKLQELLGMTN